MTEGEHAPRETISQVELLDNYSPGPARPNLLQRFVGMRNPPRERLNRDVPKVRYDLVNRRLRTMRDFQILALKKLTRHLLVPKLQGLLPN